MRAKDLPLFDALGRDLLVIHPVRRARSLVMPFALVIAFFVLAEYGRWAEAIASAMLLTFLTYGSISHDLVHRTLRLPPAVNEGFLCAIELLSLRSGHDPHDPKGETALTQTRLFRGRVLSLVALEHLYHLEHHLYPQVPHHNWPELGRRLDPYFARAGLRPVRIVF